MTEILDVLNSYTGNNFWEDVVIYLPGYSAPRTEDADPRDAGTVIVFEDGAEIRFDPEKDRWVEVC